MTPTPLSAGILKPAGIREFSPRAIVCSLLVAAVMGASYPYIVLKLGFGPNVSVVAAFFGYLALGIAFKNFNRWENNIVQSAGTAAAQTAFMCVLLAAFDMLASSDKVRFTLIPTPFQSFIWLTVAGFLGILLAVPMRRHYVVDEKLTYADGVAAGETVILLDARGDAAKAATYVMLAGVFASAVLMLMTEDAYVLKWFPSVLVVGTVAWQAMGVGINWSLLSVGSGMLVGMRINASMLLGMVLAWMIAPYLLMRYGVITEYKRTAVLLFVMWPATGMLVSGGLAALFLKWKVLANTFRTLSSSSVRGEDFPFRIVGIGVLVLSVALVILQRVMLGLEMWVTTVALLLSLPLTLVGVRVLGETNWAPISAMSNMMQGIFAVLAPGHIPANMLASGTTGTVSGQSESVMQVYKTGHMIGSSPKYLTTAQLLAVPVGAAAVSWMYPLLRNTYGIVGEHAGLSSPISRKWAGFAELLAGGAGALPPGTLWALIIGSVLGIAFAVLESKLHGKAKNWIPSPTGVGIAMLVPANVIFMMFLGGVVEWAWRTRDKRTADLYLTPLASGLIAGEAIIAVLVPLLVVTGVIHP